MKQNHPILSRLAWLIGSGAILVAIVALPSNLLWLQSSLLMFWASFSLLAFVRIFLFEGDYLAPVSFLMFYIGCVLIMAFILWLGNVSFKIIFNSIAGLAGWEFKIGNLFSGGWNYALSIPGLICGLALAAIGILWNSDIKYKLIRAAIMFFARID